MVDDIKKIEDRKQKLEAQKAKLDEKRAKIAADMRRLEARVSEAKRKRDDKRKILIGAWVLRQIKDGNIDELEVLRGLSNYLQKEHDRALFGLDGGKPFTVED